MHKHRRVAGRRPASPSADRQCFVEQAYHDTGAQVTLTPELR